MSTMLEHLAVRARVFHSGALCGIYAFDPVRKPGHLHLLHAGSVDVIDAREQRRTVTAPAVLFFPDAASHTLVAARDAQVICASLQFGAGAGAAVAAALPACVSFDAAQLRGAPALLELVASEVASPVSAGRRALLDRLCELVVITLIRHCVEIGTAATGVLAALADSRIAKVVVLMHERPQHGWTVSALADSAGMSRSRFALAFQRAVGTAPAEYLTRCRIASAQKLLRSGRPVKLVAHAVGYASLPSFSRAFTRCVGQCPSDWLGAEPGVR